MTDTRSSSPLRHLDLSDDTTVADMVAEKARQLTNSYERIEELQGALKGLLGLLHTLETNQRGVSQTVREELRNSTLIIDAVELLR
jgi:hypothetical protein